MRAVLAALLFLATAGAARAQQPVPYEQLPIEVVGIKQTEGWRLTRLMTLYWAYEVGSISPVGEPEGLERNIRGYVTGPRNRTQVWATADSQDRDNRQGCTAYHAVQFRPPSAAADEEWIEHICLRGPDAADDTAAVAPFQIGVRRIFHTTTGSFQFLRLWNGTREELNAMLEQYGQSTDISATPNSRQLRGFAPVLQALAEPWAAETASSFEICDLAGAPCASLHQAPMGSMFDRFREHAAGARLAGWVLIRGEQANQETWNMPSPAPEGAGWRVEAMAPTQYDFVSGQAAGRMLYAMTEANREFGGIFVVGGPRALIDPSAPRLRAYLLKLARVIGPAPRTTNDPNGNPPSVPYSDMLINLWPEQ